MSGKRTIARIVEIETGLQRAGLRVQLRQGVAQARLETRGPGSERSPWLRALRNSRSFSKMSVITQTWLMSAMR